MNEQPLSQPPLSSLPSQPKRPLLIVGVCLFIVLATFTAYLFMQNQSLKQQLASLSNPTPLPVETSVQEDTPKPTSSPDVSSPTPIKDIVYKYIPGWTLFKSSTGYEFQHPSDFVDFDKSGEALTTTRGCELFLTNNVGGVLVSRIVPYDGSSRRELYGTPPGYTYNYEEVVIQGKKALVIERKPLGDSGGGSGAVIPNGKYALIVSWDHRGKDSIEFNNLLRGIKIEGDIDITKCGK